MVTATRGNERPAHGLVDQLRYACAIAQRMRGGDATGIGGTDRVVDEEGEPVVFAAA